MSRLYRRRSGVHLLAGAVQERPCQQDGHSEDTLPRHEQLHLFERSLHDTVGSVHSGFARYVYLYYRGDIQTEEVLGDKE